MNTRAPALAAAALLLASLAVAGETFDYLRVFEPTATSSGSWEGHFPAAALDRDLVGVAVVGDWWDGPGDRRPGNPELSAMTGVVFEVRRGKGEWTALPPVDRDLRLVARAVAPPEATGLLGGNPDGDWSVRQKSGSGLPRALRIEFTCRGDRLLVKDLRVKEFLLPDLDPKEVLGRPWIPDRTENRTLKPGDAVAARITVENCGARKTKEVEVDLLVAPHGQRKGTRLGFAQVPALAAGESVELSISGVMPEDLALEPGVWEVVAVVDPRGVEREVETWNNALTRAFRLEPAPEKEKLPDDLRNR